MPVLHRIKSIAKVAGLTGLCVGLAATAALAQTVEMTLTYDGKKHAYRAEEVFLSVNGTKVTDLDVPPVILNDRTMVPIRAVSENLGAEVVWNEGTKEVYMMKNNDVVVIQIDNPVGNRNGNSFTMDVAPKIVNDRTLIPVRYAAEALGCYVNWDDSTRTVLITEEDPNVSKPEPPTESPSDTPSAAGEVSVNGVTMPNNASDKQAFTIKTSGEISKYTALLVGTDRLAVDIYDATVNMQASIAVTDSPVVKAIRSAQNQVTPQKITRVVFDLKGTTGYQTSLSEDKKNVIVSFNENRITDLKRSSTHTIDTVTITGVDQPAATVSYMTGPARLVIDIANATSSLNSKYDAGDSSYINNIRTSQYTENSVRVVMEIADNTEYFVSTTEDSVVVQVFKSNLKNFSYDAANRMLTLRKEQGLDIADIRHNDDYLNLKYTMTLPGDFEESFGYGINRVQDSYLNSIQVDNNSNGDTVLTFNECQIMAYTVTEDSENIYIKVQLPKEKYDKVVVIDAGHGLKDPGTSGNGFVEKNINLLVAQKIMAYLEANSSIKAYATRLDDSYPQNIARAAMGNQVADLFVSIHQNSAGSNTSANGIEVFYTPHENEQGGKLTSKIAATMMEKYLINATGATSRGAKNDPALIVLNQSTTNAILIECGFLSNSAEAAKLGSNAYQETLASAVYSCIVDMLNQYATR